MKFTEVNTRRYNVSSARLTDKPSNVMNYNVSCSRKKCNVMLNQVSKILGGTLLNKQISSLIVI